MPEILTLSELAYRRIKQQILSGEIMPGGRVNLDKCAKDLEMSPTPVREALTKLEQDSLVHYVPRSGWRVSKLSKSKYLKYRELQILLEHTLARRAALYVTTDIIDGMKASNERMREAIATMPKEDLGQFLQEENDEHFHMALYKAYHNEPMIKVLQNTWNTIKYQRMVMFSSQSFFKICCPDHEKIIEALEQRDLFALEEAVCLHFANGPVCLESSFDEG